MMQFRQWRIGFVTLGIAVVTSSLVLAHPQPGNPPKPANAQAPRVQTPGAPPHPPGERSNWPRPINPTQRIKLQEENLRRLITSCGVAEPETQDAIVAYMAEEVQARRPLRAQAQKLFRALRSDAVADEEMRNLLEEFRAVTEADRMRRQEAEAALDDKIGYTQNPRLEAMLTLFGMIGDGPLLIPFGVPVLPRSRPRLADPGRSAPTGSAGRAAAQNQELTKGQREALLKSYDKNGNGRLDGDEKAQAKAGFLRANQRIKDNAKGKKSNDNRSNQEAAPATKSSDNTTNHTTSR